MDLSVVIPTLNGRDSLGATLDALATHAPSAEVIVANGPSTDGTTGMVRARDDVDVLVEVSDRTLNVARNAGIEAATGDVVALVGHDLVVGEDWPEAVRDGLAGETGAVSGPARSRVSGGATAVDPERREICGRSVTYFDGGNVAFERAVLDALDGFDEYLETGGARDAAHRLAGIGRSVVWEPAMSARREFEADGGRTAGEWGWKYRSLAYRLVKNYGLRPTVVRRILAHAGSEAVGNAREVVRGESVPTAWFGTGRRVVGGIATGTSDGLVARARDRTPRRNPHGLSRRHDRAVARYDWR